MAWECPACNAINEADDFIRCICGFELDGDPKEYKPTTIACPECKERNNTNQSFCKKCGLNLKLYADGQLTIANKYKTFGNRFLAGLIDSFLLIIMLVILNPWLYSTQLPKAIYILHFIINSTAYYFYSVLMHGRYGQTVGKMLCNVKVIDKSEKHPITYKQAFLRDSVAIIIGLISMFALLPEVLRGINPADLPDSVWHATLSLFSTLWFFLEITTMMTNKKRRALHDYIAGTVVILTKEEFEQ